MNHVEKRVQSILWVMSHQKKKFNSVSCIRKRCSNLKKVFNSLSRIRKKFNSVSRITKSINALSHFFAKKVQFSESYFLKSSEFFQSYWKKVQFCGSYSRKRFNSLRHIEKKVQFFESSWKRKETILYFRIKKKFHSLRLFFWHKVQFFWFILLEKVQFFESFLRKFGLNSLSHILEIRFIFFWVNQKKIFLWVMLKRRIQYYESCWKEGFNTVSEKKGSILWVFFVSKIQFCESCFEKVQFFGSFFGMGFLLLFFFFWDHSNWTHTKRAQFFESYGWKKSSILWVQCKKGSTLSVKFKKVFNTLSHFLWKILLFESYWSTKSSIRVM